MSATELNDPAVGTGVAPKVLSMRAVGKRYGPHQVLSGLNLTVARGEVLALLGSNGAGKSTAIRLALGLEAPDAGEVHIFGSDPCLPDRALRQRVALIPETVGLYEELTAVESVVCLSDISTGGRLRTAHAEDALLRAGLPTQAFRRPVGTLSKGMRQKVCIALALCKSAELLVLDEPTSGLDIAAAIELNRTVKELARSGVAVLLATHDLLRARDLEARFCVLSGGSIVASFDASSLDVHAIEALFLRYASTQPAAHDTSDP